MDASQGPEVGVMQKTIPNATAFGDGLLDSVIVYIADHYTRFEDYPVDHKYLVGESHPSDLETGIWRVDSLEEVKEV